MRAPNDFQPHLADVTTIPPVGPPTWLRSQRFAHEDVFAQADRHAMEVAQNQHQCFKDLLFDLVYSYQWSDIEAVRVIFRWMTAKQMYAIEFAGAPSGSPEELLMGFRDRKSTYSRIFELLCLYSGIPCVTVVGFAKGIEFRPGMEFKGQRYNHSWNVVYVDKSWQLIDSHWATRYLQSNDSNVPENMVYEYDDFYFCPDPEALVYSHFPEDPRWQLLRQPLSMYDFEDLPVAKSAFFKNDLRFLSHPRGVISTQNGCVSVSLGNIHPQSFTFKLLYGESCKDELGGVKLSRYGIQETKDGQVNVFIRAPVKGFYFFTVYCTGIKMSGLEESIFNAVCEYRIICDVPYPNAEPYPFVSDTNWGPGAEAYQSGIIPSCRDAVIVAHDGHVELDFEKVRPLRVLPKLLSNRVNEKQLESAIKQDDNDFITRLDIDLPVSGEYALEVYVNDPRRDGNTYTHVCQYLLVRPEKGDNRDALFYQTPMYHDCYNLYGLQEPLKEISMSLEELARGPNESQRIDPASLGPRPSQKAPTQGVKVEQITVPAQKSGVTSTLNKPGTNVPPLSPGPNATTASINMGAKGDKNAPGAAAKPGLMGDKAAAAAAAQAKAQAKPLAPKPKPKPGQGSGVAVGPAGAEWPSGQGMDDYANVQPNKMDQFKGVYGDDPNAALDSKYADYGNTRNLGPNAGNQPGEYGAPGALDSKYDAKYGSYGKKGNLEPKAGSQPGEYGGSADPVPPGKYTSLGYAAKPYRVGIDPYDRTGGYSQEDLEKHGREIAGAEYPLEGGQYGGSAGRGRDYNQPTSQGLDEDFPAPPPASDMLNMESAPERSKNEIPIAPKNFEPMHIAEVDTQMTNVPKPMPPQLQENLVFSAERAKQFATVDTHAVQVAKTEHNSFRDLIWDLIYYQNITDDLDKARTIFLWLCTKDLSKMQFRNVQPGSPEEILLNVKQGKATYAQIYETLCSYAGLHCRVIRGYAKGAEYKPGMRFAGSQAFHAWNAVLIHGYWRLIDCHWASRRMFGKKGTENLRYELDDYYFCVDPRQLIYTHYPEDSQWQLLEQPYSVAQFEDMPLVKSLFFRYCLQLETHSHAVIPVNDEFALTVNYQYYSGPGLEFTFSLHTNEGEETLNGVKLSRFGVQDMQEAKGDAKVSFWVRPPAVGLFKFAVYAREVQQGETTNRMYCAVAEYLLDISFVPQHILPFPECSGNTWGISPAAAKKHGVTTKFTSGIVYTQNGQSEIRFKLNRQLLFSGKLKSSQFSEAELQSCILYRTVGETAIFSVSVPAPGEYGLEIYVNDPTKDGKMLRHMCQYLLLCTEPQVSGIRFPQLPAAYLGPQQAYTNLGMTTLSNKDPLIHCTSGSLEVSFSTSIPLRATSNLILTATNKDYTEYILQQFRNNVLSFQIRLPKAGIYKFQIFAQPLNDSSDSLPGVYNYLVNCAMAPVPPIPFPKQFSQWKEGCYLFTPIDGDLAAAQKPQDPTPNYIFYQVSVPLASRVAVVVGGEWTHLDRNAEGTWEGAAYFQAGWGKEDTAALTANYGSDSSSYNTLLEYRI